jgi:hypothetical protein
VVSHAGLAAQDGRTSARPFKMTHFGVADSF